MTESQWLACADPLDMLRAVHAEANDRKPLLFACACLDRVLGLLGTGALDWVAAALHAASQPAVRHGLPDERLLDTFDCGYRGATPTDRGRLRAAMDVLTVRWQDDTWDPAEPGWDDADPTAWDAERIAQAELLREVFGNPFRRVTLAPQWRTRTVLSLAQAAYEEDGLPRTTLDPAHLAVLADALEEAGCGSPEVLEHLRGPGPHVRGCWALDLLIAKT